MKAVFLDKDGTLLENVPDNVHTARMQLMPGARAALRRLNALGYTLIVVSNQPGIAHGSFTIDSLRAVEHRLSAMLANEGVALAGFYYCPHHPQGHVARYAVTCQCRKPQPGLVLAAAAIHHVDLSRSWMVGDILDDVEAGTRAGCRTVLLDVGNETKWQRGTFRRPDFVAGGLVQAASYISAMERRSPRLLRPRSHV